MGVPEYDSYIAPDGEVLSFNVDDRFIAQWSGYGLPPVSYISKRGPFQHGETYEDFRLEPRIVQWIFREDGCSRRDYWTRRANVINLLRPNRFSAGQFGPGVLRKKLPDGEIRDLDVFLDRGPSFQNDPNVWDEWGFSETIRFIAPDPTFYDPTLQSVTWALDPAPTQLVFPFTMPFQLSSTLINSVNIISYTGTWRTFPTITIVGPLNAFYIKNQDTAEIIELNYFISAGETVVITLEYGNKTVVSSNVGNLIGSISSNSDLATFHIAPDPETTNGDNSILITGAGAAASTSVKLEYYTRYIGL